MKTCRGAVLVAISLLALSCGSSSSGKSEGEVCGGIQGVECGGALFCQFAQGTCATADASGTCQIRPEACIEIYQPVCGCDGITYSNSCHAAAAGQSIQSEGECPK